MRDKVDSAFDLSFHRTDEVIDAVRNGRFPERSLILAHTLWTDSLSLWTFLHLREFFRNRIKLLSKNNKVVAALYNKLVKLYWK